MILISFICDEINYEIANRYLNIKKAIDKEKYDLIYLVPSTEKIDISKYNEISEDEIIYLNLKKEDFLDSNNNNNPDESFFYLGLYNKRNNYSKYLFIEWDVIVNNTNQIEGWKYVLNKLYNYNNDLICCKINKYLNCKGYKERYSKNRLSKYKTYLKDEELYFGFFPLAILSNLLLSITKKYYEDNTGFFEYIVPSLCIKNNLSCLSLSFNGFDYDESDITKQNEINYGSISWNRKIKKSYYSEYPKNYLIHPVKN